MLEEFLNAKPLYYDKIDYDRFPRIYKKIAHHLKIPKIIHLIGTNGKGTTGRFLATALYNLSYKVGHYSSPHISKFNERIWLNAEDVSDEKLEGAHQRLLKILTKEDCDALSYFEYTTFLAILLYEDLDFVVLEAGLGGEFDATAVFKKTLTLVTPIDKDHEAFLGETIKEISTTKLNAIQNKAILAKQSHNEVYEVAKSLEKEKNIEINLLENSLTLEDEKLISEISQELNLPSYLQENLALSVSALRFFGIKYYKDSFKDARLFGRLTQFCDNVIIDVGHNALAARSIVAELSANKYVLIYNTYKDKDFKEILSILKPIITHVEIINIDAQRVVSIELLHKVLIDLKIEYSQHKKIDKTNNYLIFGSFSVAQSFLREYNE